MTVLSGISIIIPYKDQPVLLEKLLESMRANAPQLPPIEILVMDDHSKLFPDELCATWGARAIPVEYGRGPAHARNQGAVLAVYDWLLFLDSDVIVPAGFFEQIAAALECHPELDALSFINQAYEPSDPAVRNFGAAIEHFWFTGNFTGDTCFAPIRGFTTRNGFVRKSAFEAVQGFDTAFVTNAHEDYDFGKRLSLTHTTLLCRHPLPYHRFPAALTRLIRNYWVRIGLFVPYYFVHRPVLDKTQTSPHEALLRVVGLAGMFWLLLAMLPLPGRTAWVGLSLISVMLYIAGVWRFLAMARRVSGTWRFSMLCLPIHYLSSVVIVAGGCWAACAYAIRPRRHNLRSAIH